MVFGPAAEDYVASGARVHRDEVSVMPHSRVGVVVCLEKLGAAGVITPKAQWDRGMRSGADELSCHAAFRDIFPRLIEDPDSHTEHLALYLSRIYRLRRDSKHDYVLMI